MNWFVSLHQQNTPEFYGHQVETKEALPQGHRATCGVLREEERSVYRKG